MSGISKAKRFRILARDGFRCRYCGAAAPDAQLRVDHIIPRAAGGHNEETNLITACSDCNAGKSDRSLTGLAKPIVKVVNRRGRATPKNDPRNRMVHLVKKEEPNHHVLNTGAIIETGEITGEDQRVRLWCMSHSDYEWHLIKAWMVGGSGGTLVRVSLPLSTAQVASDRC